MQLLRVIMKNILLFGLTSLLFGCASNQDPEDYYLNWVKNYYSDLSNLDRIAFSDSRFEKIWTRGNEVSFSILDGEKKKYVDIEKEHDIFKYLPTHSNMLYLINETGMSFGVGVSHKCKTMVCTIGVAKFRGKTPPLCSEVNKIVKGLICIEPLYKEWYTKYHYLY